MVRTSAIKSIQRDPKTGTVYTRAKGQNLGSAHQASAPGQSPATDTGSLVSSIKVIHDGLKGKIGSALNYAFWLEYGTLKMSERPFLRPALADNEKKINELFERAMTRATEAFNNGR